MAKYQCLKIDLKLFDLKKKSLYLKCLTLALHCWRPWLLGALMRLHLSLFLPLPSQKKQKTWGIFGILSQFDLAVVPSHTQTPPHPRQGRFGCSRTFLLLAAISLFQWTRIKTIRNVRALYLFYSAANTSNFQQSWVKFPSDWMDFIQSLRNFTPLWIPLHAMTSPELLSFPERLNFPSPPVPGYISTHLHNH